MGIFDVAVYLHRGQCDYGLVPRICAGSLGLVCNALYENTDAYIYLLNEQECYEMGIAGWIHIHSWFSEAYRFFLYLNYCVKTYRLKVIS